MQMSPRRMKKNEHLADNLYYKDSTRTVLYYRNPVTGKKIYLTGKTEEQANDFARRANALLPEIHKNYRRDHVPELLDAFVDDYMLPKQYAASTLKERMYKINRLKKDFHGKHLSQLTVLDLGDYLDQYAAHSRKHIRLMWIEIYRYALSKGLADANIAERTLVRKVPKRQRDRLSIEQYRIIYDIAPEWFQIAMSAALLTLQRRDDLLNIKHSDYIDGKITLVQQKTGTGLKITANSALDDVFRQSRATSVPSPYLIHRKPLRAQKGRSGHWTQVEPEMLTRTFKKLRDQALPDSTATWYEIKSLGGRMLKYQLIAQGTDEQQAERFVQALMGHDDVATTQIYLNDGITWQMAEVGLKI